MLKRTRLLFGMLVSCGSTLIPFLSAQAQDAVSSQAYAQMNQVQQALRSGLINSAQANDLMSRYNDVLVKDQQWSMQDGGRLNVPDRLDLQGKLKSDSKRMTSDLKNNGFPSATNGILPGLFGGAYNTMPYGATGLNTVPLGSMPLSTMPYGYASGTAPVTPTQYNGYTVSPAGYAGSNYYPSSPYSSGVYNTGSGVFQGLLNRWRGY